MICTGISLIVSSAVTFGVANTTTVSLSNISQEAQCQDYMHASSDGFICHCTTDWLNYVMQMKPKGSTVLDVYGYYGEILVMLCTIS